MSENQHFCLKWNNHQSTLVSLFPSLLDTNTFVDCTLAAGGKHLQAHKVVLSACSPYLKELLVQHTDKHPIIILNNIYFNELVAIVDFMYKGEVNISQEHLAAFLKAAKALQIKGLSDQEENESSDKIIVDKGEYLSPELPSSSMKRESPTVKRESPSIKSFESVKDLPISEIHSSSDSSIGNLIATNKVENWENEIDDYEDDDMDTDILKTQIPFSVPVTSSDVNVVQRLNFTDFSHSSLNSPMDLFQRVFPLQQRRSVLSDTPFACDSCHKTYRSKTSLNLHKRWECGKEPRFRCPFCDKRTHQKGNLKVHIMSRHRDRLPQDSPNSVNT